MLACIYEKEVLGHRSQVAVIDRVEIGPPVPPLISNPDNLVLLNLFPRYPAKQGAPLFRMSPGKNEDLMV